MFSTTKQVLFILIIAQFFPQPGSNFGFPKLEPVNCVLDTTGFCIRYVSVTHPIQYHNYYAPNLDPFLIPFSKQNCFQLIDNYYNLRLPSMSSPVVIRFMEFVTIYTGTSQTGGGWREPHAFWTPANHKYINGSGYVSLNCTKSRKFYQTSYNYHDMDSFCLTLDMLQFTSSSKPWNCQVHFHFFKKPE